MKTKNTTTALSEHYLNIVTAPLAEQLDLRQLGLRSHGVGLAYTNITGKLDIIKLTRLGNALTSQVGVGLCAPIFGVTHFI